MTAALAQLNWYVRNRARSRQLFDLISDEAYYSQPIDLRHPIVFYEGHLPGFSFNTLIKRALGRSGIDPQLEALFARGIDPGESVAQRSLSTEEQRARWPSRAVVQAFAEEADRQILDALRNVDLDGDDYLLLDRDEAIFTLLEHEAMHQETLLYMWHRLPFAQKKKPVGYEARTQGPSPAQEWIEIPSGCVTLGVDRTSIPFGWDNEFPALSANVPALAIERHDVTNARFLEFVEDGGYGDKRWWTDEDWQWVQKDAIAHPLFWKREGNAWRWRGMFELMPLPPSWPVYVSLAEASAFARWSGTRLPTEAEFQRAAYGSPQGERHYPWGTKEPSEATGVFDFASWDPQPAGKC
jgi:iron(II)-dependent oxidoreductase